jgi:uncharacterized protein (TIGR03067 family)
MKTALVLLIALGLAKDDAVKKEMDKLQGEWKVAGAQKDGKDLTEADRRKLSDFFLVKAVIKDDTVQLWIQEKENDAKGGDAIRYQLDLTKNPKTIQLGDDLPAIYSLDGDTLKVCFHDELSKKTEDRPTSLDTSKNDRAYLFILKRAKK